MNRLMIFALGACLMTAARADEMTIEMRTVDDDGVGAAIGDVKATTTPWGVLLKPHLSDLPPGMHGFHVHENPTCEPAKDEGEITAAYAAGSHYDPAQTGKHRGPYGSGHLGDLPPLYVDSEGNATHPVLAPRLKLNDLNERALMVHVHGDNYSDKPVELGGGGPRMACGVIE
ncbi:MAG: superoxide dismutase family protein [Gammaproteobacteria bacterium]|nr:superoxide dismutase family protein [Gammaproteobacteria bacterium]